MKNNGWKFIVANKKYLDVRQPFETQCMRVLLNRKLEN